MKRKLIAGLLACAIVFGATSFSDGAVVRAETQSVTVTAQVDGSYTVTIPKEIVLTLQEDGSHAGNYDIDVEGVIANNSYVSVVPQAEITLSSEGRDDVPCDVTQDIKYFRSRGFSGDISGEYTKIADGSEASGTVKTRDGYALASGSWQGTLVFDINLNTDAVSTASDVSGNSAEDMVE